MLRVKGLYDGQNIKLLEKIDFPNMTEVEIFLKPIQKRRKSLARQLKTMKKGFNMGRVLIKSRDELHER